MLLMIDNYDSFTYNLVQYLGELGQEVRVVRNDAIDVAGIRALAPARIMISPGPGTPDDSGVSLEVLRELAGEIPVFGVCLGHQAIGQVFGGKVIRARQIMHGKTSPIHHRGQGVFAGLPEPFEATRYHSLVVEQASLPDCLEVTTRRPSWAAARGMAGSHGWSDFSSRSPPSNWLASRSRAWATRSVRKPTLTRLATAMTRAMPSRWSSPARRSRRRVRTARRRKFMAYGRNQSRKVPGKAVSARQESLGEMDPVGDARGQDGVVEIVVGVVQGATALPGAVADPHVSAGPFLQEVGEILSPHARARRRVHAGLPGHS